MVVRERKGMTPLMLDQEYIGGNTHSLCCSVIPNQMKDWGTDEDGSRGGGFRRAASDAGIDRELAAPKAEADIDAAAAIGFWARWWRRWLGWGGSRFRLIPCKTKGLGELAQPSMGWPISSLYNGVQWYNTSSISIRHGLHSWATIQSLTCGFHLPSSAVRQIDWIAFSEKFLRSSVCVSRTSL
jgi:hypothetical protein